MQTSRQRLRRAACALALVAVSLSALGDDGFEIAGSELAGERPDPEGTPTPVQIGIYLFDVDAIDDVRQRFSVDFVATVRWTDSRLVVPREQRRGQMRALGLDEVWTPRLMVVNDRSLATQLPKIVEVDDEGNVLYVQRLTGELGADLLFRDFPFDSQQLPINIISYYYRTDELELAFGAGTSGDDGSFSAEGWQLQVLGNDSGEFHISAQKEARPRLTFIIGAERNTRYYLWTMVLPMTLIIFMSWTVFWLPPDIVPSRIAISTASIFSLIAFGFSIRLSLPPVSYLTRADYFVVGCTLMVFLALGTAVAGSRWASSDRMELALALNRFARWAYVGLFAIVMGVALLS